LEANSFIQLFNFIIIPFRKKSIFVKNVKVLSTLIPLVALKALAKIVKIFNQRL